METELISLIATTTGPLGTILAVGFMWIRSGLKSVQVELAAAQRERMQCRADRKAMDRRLERVERYAFAPAPAREVATPAAGLLT